MSRPAAPPETAPDVRASPGRLDAVTLAALVGACLLWGASFPFGKVALARLPFTQVVLWRFVLALAVLLPLTLRRGFWPARADVPRFVLAGLLGVPVLYGLQFGGLALTSATRAALIVGTFPPILALLAVWFEGEKLGTAGWTAVACSTVGAAVMVGAPGGGGSLLGDALVLASIGAAALWTLLTKRLVRRYRPLPTTALTFLLGTVFLAPIVLARDGLPPVDLPLGTWGALAGLGFGCTALTFGLWSWALQRTSASRAGVFVNLEPLAGAAFGVLLLGEPFSPGLVLGGGLVVLGAWVVTRS